MDQRDKLPSISPKHIDQKSIILYASEMMTLIKYFLILFDDVVANYTPAWKLFLTLRQILDFSHVQSLQIEIVEQLKAHIAN